jgi:hypothetical protein
MVIQYINLPPSSASQNMSSRNFISNTRPTLQVEFHKLKMHGMLLRPSLMPTQPRPQLELMKDALLINTCNYVKMRNRSFNKGLGYNGFN